MKTKLLKFLNYFFDSKQIKNSTPTAMTLQIKKEVVIAEIAENLFLKALASFPQFISIGVVLDDKEENGYMITAGFSSPPNSDLHFINFSLKKEDDIQQESAQKNISEAFLRKMGDVNADYSVK